MNKNMSDYCPLPIDASAVARPAEFAEPAEFPARNTHAVQAAERRVQVCPDGSGRGAYRKLHPGMLPCGEMNAREMEIARTFAVQKLNAV